MISMFAVLQPLAPSFQAFVAARREALAKDIAATSAQEIPVLRAANRAALVREISEMLSAMLEQLALGKASLEALVLPLRDLPLGKRLVADDALALVAVFRQHLLDVSLAALHGQVAGADQGTRLLMGLLDAFAAQLVAVRAGMAPGQTMDQLRDALETQTADLHTFFAIVEHAPAGILIVDLEGTIQYLNQLFQTYGGYGNELIGTSFSGLLDASDAQHTDRMMQQAASQGLWQSRAKLLQTDQTPMPIHLFWIAIHNPDGELYAYGVVVRDLRDQLRAEQEQRDLQNNIIEAQEAILREMSTPLIPITDEIVAMPLIGNINSHRAQQVIETLLTGIANRQIKTAILDITGVPVVDTHVANVLLQAAQAVRLLGVHIVLTGIRPEVAQTLVGLGINFKGIVTYATLQDGIAQAFKRRL